MKYLLYILCFVLSTQAYGQEELVYKDQVYTDYIKSVKFHHRGLFTSMPIIDLQSSGQLELSFDDMDGGDREYRYYITYCNKDWTPSELNEIEYLEGFNGEEIQEIYYSFSTHVDYTHYRLSLPNEDVQFLLSGNYLLTIYDETDDKELVLTRRMMVVEPLVSVKANMRNPTNAEKYRSHQELEFSVLTNNIRISDPSNEIEVKILQNQRWDNALEGIAPRVTKRDELVFNYIDKLNFPAYNEFRFADIRSTRYVATGIHSIDINPDNTNILMQIDQFREGNDFYDYNDINGSYVIETQDEDLQFNLLDQTVNFNNYQASITDNHTKADYVNVIFTLDLGEVVLDSDIYLTGQFTDWQLKSECKMEYDYQRDLYIGEVMLKQGYYDYYYAMDRGDYIDYEYIEGSWYETENEYTILVYYSPYGTDFDQLIALGTLKSDEFK